jgi:hypothetical protein
VPDHRLVDRVGRHARSARRDRLPDERLERGVELGGVGHGLLATTPAATGTRPGRARVPLRLGDPAGHEGGLLEVDALGQPEKVLIAASTTIATTIPTMRSAAFMVGCEGRSGPFGVTTAL